MGFTKYLGLIRYIIVFLGVLSFSFLLIPLTILFFILWVIATYYDGKLNYFNKD